VFFYIQLEFYYKNNYNFNDNHNDNYSDHVIIICIIYNFVILILELLQL